MKNCLSIPSLHKSERSISSGHGQRRVMLRYFCEKYVKTKEQLKSIPIIADIDEMQIQNIRLIFQSIALALELKT